jgi:hypothetical protein
MNFNPIEKKKDFIDRRGKLLAEYEALIAKKIYK